MTKEEHAVGRDVRNGAVKSKLNSKYLTFCLGAERYGLEILKVQEIIKMQEITFVPRSPAYIKGVINLRGQIVPVVELRLRFDMAAVEYDEKTCIVVVQVVREDSGTRQIMGIVVDEVSEVQDIPASEIEPPPAMDSGMDSEYIVGMAKAKGRVIILLDIDRILALEEMMELDRA